MKDALEGLMVLIGQLAAAGRSVVWAQAGLAGLLGIASGAMGFGSGMYYTQQRHAGESTGGGGGEPVPRYFVPQMLGLILDAQRLLLANVPGFQPCPCPFCAQMNNWSRELSGLHYLWWCANLTLDLDQQGQVAARRARLKQIVDAAVDFTAAAQDAGIQVRGHTRVWQALLP
jgi:hypothetical protein